MTEQQKQKQKQMSSLEDTKDERRPVVLIIGDSPEYPRIFELLADKLGVTTHIVQGCSEGLRALERLDFDIVVMDWQMPDIDGVICTTKIRKMEEGTARRIPIIGITGHIKATREYCLECDMDDYLAMPFTFDQLRQKIFQWLRAE